MYNVYIIGAGNKGALSDAPGSGNEHKSLSYAHAVKDHPAFKLVGFGDILPEMRIEAERIWNPENSNTIDVVVITTPDNSHYDYLKGIADCGFGLVICEKPLCDNVEQAKEIVELYKKNNVPLLVDYTRRFIPEFRNHRNNIIQGNYGNFIKGYLYFNRGWEHTASHFVDMCLWFNGSMDNIEITEIKTDYQWVYQWALFYEKDFVSEHAVNFVKEKVPSKYDRHLYLVMDNVYQYLERNSDYLFCTGEDGLRAIIETERIKNEYSINRR